MSSSKADSYEKYSDAPLATGIPVNSSDPHFSHHPAHHDHHLHATSPQPWSSGLFDCFSDSKSCCLTFWCPCITFGRIADIADKGKEGTSSSCSVSTALYTVISLVTGCQCLYSWLYRSKLRQQYSLDERPCGDFWVHCFCEPCALCQEYRELQSRGFNMSIGWHGNMNARSREVTMGSMPPTMEGGMSRDK